MGEHPAFPFRRFEPDCLVEERPPLHLSRGRLKMTSDNVLFVHSIIALVAGIVVLIVPQILNYIVAAYLILIGLAGLYPHLFG
jgi:hypothetical protein